MGDSSSPYSSWDSFGVQALDLTAHVPLRVGLGGLSGYKRTEIRTIWSLRVLERKPGRSLYFT